MIKDYNRKILDQDLESGKRLYLYFMSLGCGPCKLVTPSIEKFAEKKDNVYRIKSTEGKDLAGYLQVVSYPTFIVVEDVQIVENLVGANTISNFLNQEWFYGTSNQ